MPLCNVGGVSAQRWSESYALFAVVFAVSLPLWAAK